MDLTTEQLARLKQLFAEGLGLSQQLRFQMLERVHKEDGAAMADRLAIMLAAQFEQTDSIHTPIINEGKASEPERTVFKEGDVILNRFRVVRLLGRGGMGEVYEAHDSEIGRVALKTIRADVQRRNSLQRFKQEVQLARMVTSPHVCRIHELFTLPQDPNKPVVAFLTMEFLEGLTLADQISQKGQVPWREAEQIALQLCQGLTAIHEAGIVHRDLKSRNVMLASHNVTSRAVVMDLGLARGPEAGEAGGRPGMTLSGTVMGTPDYMAPEQFESGAVSAATDIYAMGVVLYEMVTGRLPFEASTPMGAAVRRGKRPPSASSIQPGVPNRWDKVISRCLEYDCERRFQSAQALARALTASTLPVERVPKSYQMGLILAAVILTASVFFWISLHRGYVPAKAATDWYIKGVDAFREGTYLRATGLFQSAVGADKNFALARARLADAWNELDFKGNADEEMLSVSSEQERELSPAERSYVQAVRATLRRDFPTAIQKFQMALDKGTGGERASAQVDLGRTYEKMGEISAALRAFQRGQRLAPDSPAAYMRSAILESRQGLNDRAGSDFTKAADIYTKLGSLEGTAEVAYQRSYWQSILGNYKEAREQAQKSLEAATHMPTPSVQLQARALCRFSAIDHGSSHDDQALEEASKAIKIAHENGLDYWETDALLRKGAAYFGKLDYDTAQDCFDQSLKTASRNHWPRLVALAQVNLATVRDQRGQAQDLDGLATAIDYYKIHQFPIELLNPLLLLVRDKNNQSLYESALEPALGLASLAQKLTVPIAIIQGEEAVGTSYLGLQRYPDALRHFDTALNTAIQANDAATIEWETLRRAEALAKLGRFEEAETDLRKVSNRDLAAQSSQIRTHILLSQGRFAEVVREAHRLLAAHLDQYLAVDIRIAGSTAASQSGLVSQARQWASEALSLSQKANDRELEANVQLALALVDLRALAPAAGKSAAEAALQFFEAHGQQESKWRAMLYLAEAERSLGNSQKSKEQAYKALDILSALEHNWESSAIANYENRPDVSAARHDLQKMAGR